MFDMILRYLILLGVFLLIDMIWLGLIAKNVYQKHLGFLMKKNVNWVAAFIFYMIFILGLQIFVLNPAVQQQNILHALLLGGLFGLITYATYDLTNLATLKDWPIKITLIDLIWGSVLSGATASIGYLIITGLSL